MLFDDELKKTKPKEEEKDKKNNQKENQI